MLAEKAGVPEVRESVEKFMQGRLGTLVPLFELLGLEDTEALRQEVILFDVNGLRRYEIYLHSTAVHEVTEFLVSQAGGTNHYFHAAFSHENPFVLEQEFNFACRQGVKAAADLLRARGTELNLSIYDTPDDIMEDFKACVWEYIASRQPEALKDGGDWIKVRFDKIRRRELKPYLPRLPAAPRKIRKVRGYREKLRCVCFGGRQPALKVKLSDPTTENRELDSLLQGMSLDCNLTQQTAINTSSVTAVSACI